MLGPNEVWAENYRKKAIVCILPHKALYVKTHRFCEKNDMTSFLLIFLGVLIFMCSIFWPRIQKTSRLLDKAGSMEGSNHRTQLAPTDLPAVISDLERRNPLSRALQIRQTRSIAEGAATITRANTDLIRAKGEEIETYFDKATSIAKKKEGLERLPMEMQVRDEELKAKIAKHRLERVTAENSEQRLLLEREQLFKHIELKESTPLDRAREIVRKLSEDGLAWKMASAEQRKSLQEQFKASPELQEDIDDVMNRISEHNSIQ